MRRILLGAAGLLAACTLFFLLGGARVIRVGQPEPLALTGTVEASEIDVSAVSTGRIAELLVDEGDTVQRGQPCFVIDEEEAKLQLARAQSRLEVARAELNDLRALPRKEEIAAQRARVQEAEAPIPRLRADAARARELLESKSITQASFDEAMNALEVGETRVVTAQRQLDVVLAGPRPSQLEEARARASELQHDEELAALELARRRVVAPVNGVVLRRNFQLGELATPGAPVLTLIDRSQLWVELAADERTHGRLQLEQAARIAPESLPGEPPLAGHVSFIAERHGFTPRDVETRDERARLTYRLKVRIENPPESIKPGMFVSVTFPEAEQLSAAGPR